MTADLVRNAPFGPFDLLSDWAYETCMAGRPHEAWRACQAALRVTVGAGDIVTTRYLRYIACMTLEEQGDWSSLRCEAQRFLDDLSTAERAPGHPHDGGPPYWRAKGLGLLSHALMQLGDPTAALEPLAEGYGLIMNAPKAASADTYSRASACQAIAVPLARALLFEPATRLVDVSVPLLTGHPEWAAVTGIMQANVHALWGLFLDLIGHDADANRQYAACASRSIWGEGRARAAGDAEAAAALRAYLQFGLQRLRCEPVDEQALRIHAVGRQRLPMRLALASAVARRGDHAAGRELTAAVRDDAERWGEPVCLWVAEAWLAQLHEAAAGATGATRGWREVAVTRLEHLWQDRSGRFDALVSRQRVAELTERVERDDRQLWQDALTGVANRRLLDAALAQPAATGRPAVFVDVDRFKHVNDEHGHDVGDAVLVAVAEVLRGMCRADDVVARYGGDEFVVVLGDGADPEAFAARLRAAVTAWPWDLVSPGLAVTVSAGTASGPEALRRADLALRDVKAHRSLGV